ncbi:MAG TPA: PorP/SprF family type IX secretion system membrane protein [Cytophagaceae bacterium]
MKKQLLLILIIVLFPVLKKGYAQDIHFSQFYNTPLSLNPALTGFFPQDIRLGFIYRNQWKQINSAFETMAFSGDANFPINESGNDKVGAGLFLFNDNMGEGIIKNNSFFVSGSYIKILDVQKRHSLSAGLQFGVVQKSIDYSGLFFNNQIRDYQYDPSIASGEPLGLTRFSYLNTNAGVYYKVKVSEMVSMRSGISFYNVNKPKETFMQRDFGDINKLKNRFIWSWGMDYKLNDKFTLIPDMMFMTQTRAIDFNIGSAIAYTVQPDPEKLTVLKGGVYYRTFDALILMAGLNYKNYQFTFSYDKTVSRLNQVKGSYATYSMATMYGAQQISQRRMVGAYEITLIYTGFLPRAIPNEHTVPCKFF